MLMALDSFVFSLPTVAYQELQRQTNWKHRMTPRVGARDANQYLGPGDDVITLSGVLAPELTGTLASLAQLRAMADTGDAFSMVDGGGAVYGAFIIETIEETHTFMDAKGTPRRVEFKITLKRVDDSRATSFASKSSLPGLPL